MEGEILSPLSYLLVPLFGSRKCLLQYSLLSAVTSSITGFIFIWRPVSGREIFSNMLIPTKNVILLLRQVN